MLLNITFLIIFWVKNTHNLKTFKIFLGENIDNVLTNFLRYVFRILFNNDLQQFSFNSAKKMAKKMVPKHYF